MTVCPHCGRNLVPAGPRWALWLPLGLLLIFVAYWGRDRLPTDQIKQRAATAQSELASMIRLPDLITPTITPTSGLAVARLTPFMPTPSRTPTATPSPWPTATPSPTPTPTATGGAREYIVQPGDSLALIGDKLDLPWRTIAALNGLTEYSLLRPGDKLRLPTLTPAPTPRATPTSPATATPSPTASPALVATAGMPASPGLTPSPTATATPTASPTETPRPAPTRPPAPTATATNTPAPQLAAPVLTNPGNQTPYSGENTQIVLEWQSPDGLPRGAVYRLTITWVEKGAPITWSWDTTTTSLYVARWLWQRADQPARQYTWWVQIVQLATDGKGGERVIPLSPPSEKRMFSWN